MLKPRSQKPLAIQARKRRSLRRHWDQPNLPTSIGCPTCPQYMQCGGLHTELRQFDCLAHCCGQPSTCTKVCRNKPRDFTLRVREIGGFDLKNVARGPELLAPPLPAFVPLLYHNSGRSGLLPQQAVALSLYALFDKRTGTGRYADRQALCDAYGIHINTSIVLSGTHQDPPLERWWQFGETRRRQIISYLLMLGIDLVTTPNYSLFANTPRWDDLHSLKRIATTYAEFIDEGLPAALHVNGRNDNDFLHWKEFIRERPEISHLSYEFGTGAKFSERITQHVNWLCSLAEDVKRPLTLVVRGGLDALPSLSSSFSSVVFIDTSVFMRTMKRRLAVREGNKGLAWRSSPTLPGASLNTLFLHNASEMQATVEFLLSSKS